MMEYQTIIRFGKNTLKVTFTGGSMNAIGVTPATFTTNNFLIQQAIENSSEFTRGRICIVKVVELDEELRIERAKPAPVAVPKKCRRSTCHFQSTCRSRSRGRKHCGGHKGRNSRPNRSDNRASAGKTGECRNHDAS